MPCYTVQVDKARFVLIPLPPPPDDLVHYRQQYDCDPEREEKIMYSTHISKKKRTVSLLTAVKKITTR